MAWHDVKNRRWVVKIHRDGRSVYIGSYMTEEEANAVYNEVRGFDGTLKRCAGCDTRKPLSAFGTDRPGIAGVNATCRECKNAKTKDWKARNREKYRAHMQVSEATQAGLLIRVRPFATSAGKSGA